MSQTPWADKISNTAQLGGIETSVLDNGIGRGNRIAWVNTGAGLRYKVVLDRGMDIAEAFYQEHSLAWLSHSGFTVPNMFHDQGLDWLRTFGGGLLTTCGLSHVGGPERDNGQERGLHGLVSNLPAEINAVVQPVLSDEIPVMRLEGRVLESKVFGPTLELRRTISSPLGMARLRIHDVITNLGNVPAPLMVLYHFNFGWPLVNAGSRIIWKGNWRARSAPDAEIFNEGNQFTTCPDPMKAHRGAAEAVAFIDPEPDGNGLCHCGIVNDQLEVAAVLSFRKAQLPWLSNWQHWGPGEYVTGLEPGTNPPIGQAKARSEGSLIMLEPGEQRNYEIDLAVVSGRDKIDQLMSSI